DHTLVEGKDARPYAKEAINILREAGYKIIIHSCNNKSWIEKVLNDNDIRYDYIWCAESVDKPTTFRNDAKPVADLYIDDRGYHFRGNWEKELPEILSRLETYKQQDA
ncbi:MAG TPA: hypothetical protein VM577_00795, partial [Anaerovoracaceae bacterium]|nr:hypothetical protein [Anaerovoracaceae bacterium]